MGGLTQFLLCLLGDIVRRIKQPGRHRVSSTIQWRYHQILTPPNPLNPPNPHICNSLTHIGCYMNYVISTVQGGTRLQHQVFDVTVLALKWIFPPLPVEFKGLVSFKKILAGKFNWNCVKEVLDCTIDTEAGTVALLECKHGEILTLVDIPSTKRRMKRKYLK